MVLRRTMTAAFIALVFGAGAAKAAEIKKVNVVEDKGRTVITVKGDEELRYKVSQFTGGNARVVVTFFNVGHALPYDKIPYGKGKVESISFNLVEENSRKNVVMSVRLTGEAEADFDVSKDKKEFGLRLSGGGHEGAGMVQLEDGPVKSKGGFQPLPPSGMGLPLPSGDLPSIGGGAKNRDTSPFIADTMNFVDAGIEFITQTLGEITGANVSADVSILQLNAEKENEGVPTGLTMRLSNVTLEEALDIITLSQGWAWLKRGDTYIVMSKERANENVEAVKESGFDRDNLAGFQSRVFHLKHLDVREATIHLSLIVPQKQMVADAEKNTLLVRATPEQLSHAEELLRLMDVESDIVIKMLELKYIRGRDFVTMLNVLLEHPYFGGRPLGALDVQGTGGANAAGSSQSPIHYLATKVESLDISSESRATVEGNLSAIVLDDKTNTIVYVGTPKTYERVLRVVDEIDVPAKAQKYFVYTFKYMDVNQGFYTLDEKGKESEDKMSVVSVLKGFLQRGDSPVFKDAFYLESATNSIVFFGTPDDWGTFLTLFQEMDTPESEIIVEPIKLEHVSASDLAASGMLEEYIKTMSADTSYSTAVQYNYPMNTILLTSWRRNVPLFREFIKKLDVDAAEFGMTTKVYALNYINPFRATKLIESILNGGQMNETDSRFFDFSDETAVSSGSGGFSGAKDQLSMPNLNVLPDITKNALIVRADKLNHKKVSDIIAIVDVKPRQVRLDISVVELDQTNNKTLSLGVLYQDGKWAYSKNWTDYHGGSTSIQTANGQQTFNFSEHNKVVNVTAINQVTGLPQIVQVIADPYHNLNSSILGSKSGFMLFDSRENFPALFSPNLQAIITESVGQIITNPTVIAYENRPATFDFTDQIPILETNVTSTGVVTQSSRYEAVGVRLTVTPHISEDGKITLSLDPLSVDSLAPNLGISVNDVVTPGINKRTVTMEISLEDGEPLVLGGIRRTNETTAKTKVPMLGDLPIIGKMFRDKQTEKIEKEIVIIITPTVVKDEV